MALELDASDLETYLGVEVDEARGNMLISHAFLLCQSIVDPVPDQAEPIVLAAAARAYVNPSFTRQEMEGPYQATRERGGVYLTAGERLTVRRWAGRSSAFMIDTIPSGADGS